MSRIKFNEKKAFDAKIFRILQKNRKYCMLIENHFFTLIVNRNLINQKMIIKNNIVLRSEDFQMCL
jgi:hypothetical protein